MKTLKNILKAGLLASIAVFIPSCQKEKLPDITTAAISEITSTTATSGGNVTNDGGAAIVSKGVCWNTSYNPTVENSKTNEGSGLGSYTSFITPLTPNTYYYLRAYVVKSTGIVYGNQIHFTTLCDDKTCTVMDIEGNIYNTITIGTQKWMKENLKTTKFLNGSDIPLVTSSLDWYNLNTPGYCWYNNNPKYKATYGGLYNWYAIDIHSNGNKNICPLGFHIPTDAEWTTLITYMGGDSVAVGKLKETGISHWQIPNSDATDEMGFTALPGGGRDLDGRFYDIGKYGFWWSASEFVPGGAWSRFLGYDGRGGFSHRNFENDGFSVRCVKDN